MLGKQKHYIVPANEVSKYPNEQVGHKAIDLNQISQLGVPICNYFVITASAFDDFIVAANLTQAISEILGKLSKLTTDQEYSVAAQNIRDLIIQANFPSTVLTPIIHAYNSLSGISPKYVRLSASQVVSLVNVPKQELDREVANVKEEAQLLVAVKEIWASLFAPAALKLRVERAYSEGLSLAIVVERSPQLESSGKAYSLDPVTGEPKVITVEAILGIMVTNSLSAFCDIYKIDTQDQRIVEKTISAQMQMYVRKAKVNPNSPYMEVKISPEWQRKQKLDDTQIQLLAGYITKLKASLETDIEADWAYELGKLTLTDVRPYTSLTPPPAKLEAPLISKPQDKKPTSPKIELTLRPKKVNIPQLAAEVQEMVTPSVEELPEFSTAGHIVIDLSMRDSSTLASIPESAAGYIDSTELISKLPQMPETLIEDDASLNEVIEKIALEVSVVNKLITNTELFYQFSSLAYNNTPGEPDLAARFILQPAALIAEYLGIKRAYNNYSVRNINLIIPGIRQKEELVNIKKALSSQSFRRHKHSKLYAEVIWPGFSYQLSQLDNDMVDGIFVDIGKYAERMLGTKDPVYKDLATPIANLVLLAKSKGWETGIVLPAMSALPILESLEQDWDYIVIKTADIATRAKEFLANPVTNSAKMGRKPKHLYKE